MLLVAIPAFNEEGSIAAAIADVQQNLPEAEILVINDGSIDNTANIAKSFGVKVISMPFNTGVGGALRLAFRYAAENGFNSVLQFDADGQHIASQAQLLLESAEENSIIIGSRFSDNSNEYQVNLVRRFAMSTLAYILSKICKTKLTDVTSGFRLTSGSVIAKFAQVYPRDYLGDTVESLVLANKYGFAIKEVSVKMQERQSGKPSQNSIKSLWYLVRTLLVIFLSLIRKK